MDSESVGTRCRAEDPVRHRSASTKRRWLSAVAWRWLPVAAVACAPDAPDAVSFYSGACRLADAALEPCDSCIDFELAATLGADDDDGFLVDRGTFGDIVRDHDGNYWAGQRTEIKIFDSAGTYLATVGRAGEGPMEFDFAQPMHTDSLGRIHVFDIGNARVSVIAPDRTLSEQRRLPASWVPAMTPLADGDRYAIQSWIRNAERIGFPLHVVDDGSCSGTGGLTGGREWSRSSALEAGFGLNRRTAHWLRISTAASTW